MRGIIDGFGRLGANIALLALSCVIFGIAIWAGIWVAERTKKNWQGWLIGLVVLAIMSLIFSSTYGAVERATCYHMPDFQACMDDDGDE